MKLGRKEFFCNCLLKNLKDHITVVDEDDNCLYCSYAAVNREVTEKDIRTDLRYGEDIKKKKMEALELYVKYIKHGEKMQ